MTPTAIRYERVHNLGNYESERICVEATVNEGENVQDAMDELKAVVMEQLARLQAQRIAPENLFEGEWK